MRRITAAGKEDAGVEKEWTVSVWGVRGSMPVPASGFLEYGGNTSCVSVDCGTDLVVFDAGSGLMGFGDSLRAKKNKRVDILLSHLHMDHCLGLFGFGPLYDPEAEIHLYGGAETENGFCRSLETLLGAPYWPVGLRDFRAHVRLHEIRPGESFLLGGKGVTVSTTAGNHPGGSVLYRLDGGGKSVVYALDCEINDAIFESLAEFSRGSGLILWDAGFVPEDLERYRGWGHSTWEQGIALRRVAGADRILMAHFAPNYTDAFLREQERLAGQADPACHFAREGMKILL